MEIKGTNEYNHLILKYSENNHYKDITDEVIYLKENYNHYFVVFKNRNNYKISFSDIIVCENVKDLKLDNKYIVYCANKFLIFKALIFDDKYIKIFTNNNTKILVNKIEKLTGNTYLAYNDEILAEPQDRLMFYYKMLSWYQNEQSNDDNGVARIINNRYSKISDINKESVFYSYSINNIKELNKKMNYIYPFISSYSQMNAIDKAFKKNITVISGPPGTGKTQVILNLIANAVYNDMNIGVISNNNSAIKNVYDKLSNNLLSNFIANLGSYENVNNFFVKKDNMINYNLGHNSLSSKDELHKKILTYRRISKTKNEIALLNEKLSSVIKEKDHFISRYKSINYYDFIPNDKESSYYLNLANNLIEYSKLNIIKRLIFFFKFKIRNITEYSLDDLYAYLINIYYDKKISCIKKEIDNKISYLKQNSINIVEDDIIKLSTNLLNSFLNDKFNKFKDIEFTSENFKENFEDFIRRYPVILSTTYSISNNIPDGYLLDYLIIDEASQSEMISSILAMNCAKNIVVIGDEKQLPEIDNNKILDFSKNLATTLNIELKYLYNNQSMLKSFSKLSNISYTTLLEHYRCSPAIIKYCNSKFYNNELVIMTHSSAKNDLNIIKLVQGNHARRNPSGTGWISEREADEVLKLVSEIESTSVGVITPFKSQAILIKSKLKTNYDWVEVDTIHSYQGRQKDVIILCSVLNDFSEKNECINSFVCNNNLLNVAVSRAVKKLYIIVSDGVFNSENNNIRDLIDYSIYQCGLSSVKQGDIVSVFDTLYSDLQLVNNNKYDSLAEKLLDDEIKKNKYILANYKYRMHVRLSDLLNDYSGFNEKEIKYLTHINTHVDFVFFNKLSYKPILCVEVDGTKYHLQNEKQLKHDNIKDKALHNNKINILRLKTNESNELQRILQLI